MTTCDRCKQTTSDGQWSGAGRFYYVLCAPCLAGASKCRHTYELAAYVGDDTLGGQVAGTFKHAKQGEQS